MSLRWGYPLEQTTAGAVQRRETARAQRLERIAAAADFNSPVLDPNGAPERFREKQQVSSGVPCHKRQTGVPNDSNQLVLTGRLWDGWIVKKPLAIRVERDDDGSYVVSDDIFAVHGDGSSRRRAVMDYITSLIEYYALMESRSETDAPTRELFGRLQQYLEQSGQ